MFMDLQKFVDTLNKAGEDERAKYHLTLGRLIERLETMPDDLPIRIDAGGWAPGEPRSYRGYYSDLAFEPLGDLDTVGKLRARARMAMGETFEGYKGGDFTMHERTPLWVASYGDCGRAVVGIDVRDDAAVLITTIPEDS